MAYLEFEIPVRSWTSSEVEILLAKMAQTGFEGFIEEEDVVKAYINKDLYSGDLLNELLDELSDLGIKVQYHFHETDEQNWNEEWEKKFNPVTIGHNVLIRAPFHSSSGDLEYTVIIEPKMSFGTGHHHTTRLMISEIMKHNLKDRWVLDMGCGTGILGILACKLQAEKVLGIDIDQWAYENALENISRNDAGNMEVRLGDVSVLGNEIFDFVLANITRNTLVRDIPVYYKHMDTGGLMIVSGILTEDVQYVLNSAYRTGLEHMNTMEESNWLSLCFVK